jgi:hypothetical protein
MSTDALCIRFLSIFESGSAKELAAVLQLLLMLSTHNNKMSRQDLHFLPALDDECKVYKHYLIALTPPQLERPAPIRHHREFSIRERSWSCVRWTVLGESPAQTPLQTETKELVPHEYATQHTPN